VITLLVLMLAATGTPAEEFELALPVGSNSESSRPFLIQAWPDGGCPNCIVNDDDKAALKIVINDLKAPVGTASTYPGIKFHYVSPRPLADSVTSIDNIREKIEACRFGTAAILSPYPTSNVTAFGLRFDCDATKTLMWMSVVMGNDHRPILAYLVPNYPLPLKKVK
jgi:hypothetical protein